MISRLVSFTAMSISLYILLNRFEVLTVTNNYLHVLEEADVEAAKALDIMLPQKPAEKYKNISWKQKSRPEPKRLHIVLGIRWIKRSVTKSDTWVHPFERGDFVLFSVSRSIVKGDLTPLAYYLDFPRIKRKPLCKPHSALQSGFALVGVTGFEPAASTSQMSHATNCATPRKY